MSSTEVLENMFDLDLLRRQGQRCWMFSFSLPQMIHIWKKLQWWLWLIIVGSSFGLLKLLLVEERKVFMTIPNKCWIDRGKTFLENYHDELEKMKNM